MSRVQARNLDKELRYEIMGDFYDVVSHLKTKKEIVDFFMGLFSDGEAIMFARRIKIAKMLVNGHTYDQINKELGAGIATIASVSQWLNDENEEFQIQINKHIKRQKQWRGNRRSNYNRILNPYRQIKIVKDILENN